MDIDLELFQGADQRYYGEYELDDVLRKAAVRHFGDLARHDLIHLTLDEPADPQPYPGPPEVRNLATRLGYCRLQVTRDGQAVREERLRIVELLGPVLAQELSKLEPGEAQWGFVLRRRRLLALVLADNLVENIAGRLTSLERPVPEVKGSVEVDLGEPRHRPFTLTPMASADAEVVRPEDLGLDPASLDKLNILMSADIYDQFLHRMPLESRMEEGGFLLGRVTKAGDQAHLVEITHVTPAHRSGAGMVHFTFTGESFLAVAQLLEERGQQEELVGWYHTHLFSIGFSMGLSSIDVDLHLATFQRPWQVAALINMRRRGRVLRFYGRGEEGLQEYKQWVCDDSGRYRPADHAMGGQ
jgi:proteasome lid subunit RPN8/RPN11